MSKASFFSLLNKPEYLFRPVQNFRRFLKKNSSVKLPWNVQITVNPNETVGRSILNTGFHDLTVTESIVRLVGKGEIVVDAGANFGYFTLLMSRVTGSQGSVYAFEPHPGIYRRLQENINKNLLPNVHAHELGLSSRIGDGYLIIPDSFGNNEGLASVSFDEKGSRTEIKLTTVDAALSGVQETVGLMKIDVEGHELDLLKGASTFLKEHRIRDIVYEDHHDQPSEVARYLQSFGYTLFRLEKRLFGPKLHPHDLRLSTPPWETPNYLATLNAKRVISRFQPFGWKCMKF